MAADHPPRDDAVLLDVAAGFGEVRDRKTGETLRIPLANLADAAFALVGKKKAECAP